MHQNRKRSRFLFLTLFFIVLTIWISVGNRSIQISEFDIENNRIPAPFDGFTIVQISDLHNAEFGEEQLMLTRKIAEIQPDLIAVTGDLIDSDRDGCANAVKLMENVRKLAPVYFVTGNHEAWSRSSASTLRKELQKLGVVLLDDTAVELKRGEASIQLLGLADPDTSGDHDWFTDEGMFLNDKLQNMALSDSAYRILLSHRPEWIETYAEYPIDLVLSGHAHGGQFRIPYVGGLVAPGQGLFPKYTSGVYSVKDTKMAVSRGLGNSVIPVRINNRPELVVIRLRHQSSEIEF